VPRASRLIRGIWLALVCLAGSIAVLYGSSQNVQAANEDPMTLPLPISGQPQNTAAPAPWTISSDFSQSTSSSSSAQSSSSSQSSSTSDSSSTSSSISSSTSNSSTTSTGSDSTGGSNSGNQGGNTASPSTGGTTSGSTSATSSQPTTSTNQSNSAQNAAVSDAVQSQNQNRPANDKQGQDKNYMPYEVDKDIAMNDSKSGSDKSAPSPKSDNQVAVNPDHNMHYEVAPELASSAAKSNQRKKNSSSSVLALGNRRFTKASIVRKGDMVIEILLIVEAILAVVFVGIRLYFKHHAPDDQ
jgi:hypothetical protein